MVEEKADDMLLEAREFDVAFLVVGDPFGATTHSDLVVRAKKMEVDVKVIYNASVMNAVGVCGLQLYRYGETVSLPFFTKTWRPDSFYEKIQRNRGLGLHTLCLLGNNTIYIGSGSNGNSNLIVNVRTVEIAPRGIFTPNNHRSFGVNN